MKKRKIMYYKYTRLEYTRLTREDKKRKKKTVQST